MISAPSQADDCAAPCAGYALSLELADDYIAEPPALQSNALEATVDAELFVRPVAPLTLATLITVESVRDTPEGEDRAFGDMGAYLYGVYAEAGTEDAGVRVGKFDPRFGLATQVLDGIHATDLVGEYDLEERWAVQAAIDLGTDEAARRLTAGLFTTDRTVFSDSLFTRRGRTTLTDGGAGNTEGVSSAAVVFDTCRGAGIADCYEEGDVGYRLGLLYQKAGQATPEQREEDIEPRDETGILAAGIYGFEAGESDVRLLGEAAYFRNLAGDPGASWFATGGVEIENGPFIWRAGYSRQWNEVRGRPDTFLQLVDVTATYSLESFAEIGETALAASYSFAEDEDGQRQHVVTLQLTLDIASDADD